MVNRGPVVRVAPLAPLRMRPELCVHIRNNSWSPELGYPVVRDLLATGHHFTAVFCFNDIAAIGASRSTAWKRWPRSNS